jgi:hypothetical protein
LRCSGGLADVGCDARRAHDWLAVSRLHVMPDVENWSAPSVMAALAGVVHDRQAAAGHEHHQTHDN